MLDVGSVPIVWSELTPVKINDIPNKVCFVLYSSGVLAMLFEGIQPACGPPVFFSGPKYQTTPKQGKNTKLLPKLC